MFEDIVENIISTKNIGKKKIDVDIGRFEREPFCPYCGSKDVKNTGGVFVPGKKFKSFFECSFCGNEWDVLFDKDTNVKSIDAWI
jgi:transcription elongation factor Elf1